MQSVITVVKVRQELGAVGEAIERKLKTRRALKRMQAENAIGLQKLQAHRLNLLLLAGRIYGDDEIGDEPGTEQG